MEFNGNAQAVLPLLIREVIQSLKSDDTSIVILYQYHVVVGFLADELPLRIVEPDTESIAVAVVVHP